MSLANSMIPQLIQNIPDQSFDEDANLTLNMTYYFNETGIDENLEKGGPIVMADFTIVNTGTVDQLKEKISEVLSQIK